MRKFAAIPASIQPAIAMNFTIGMVYLIIPSIHHRLEELYWEHKVSNLDNLALVLDKDWPTEVLNFLGPDASAIMPRGKLLFVHRRVIDSGTSLIVICETNPDLIQFGEPSLRFRIYKSSTWHQRAVRATLGIAQGWTSDALRPTNDYSFGTGFPDPLDRSKFYISLTIDGQSLKLECQVVESERHHFAVQVIDIHPE